MNVGTLICNIFAALQQKYNDLYQPMKQLHLLFVTALIVSLATKLSAQRNVTNANDSNTPLHLLKPDYPIPYGLVKTEHRLKDGSLARNRPQPKTLWVDDLFMGVPALAQMGKLTGEKKYYDEAAKQGTGMAFDPAFYYHRPISPFAAHGYGPVILAASGVINLLKNKQFKINDTSVQLLQKK